MAKLVNTRSPRRAKNAADQVGGKSRSDHRWFAPVLDELRVIFPHKLAPNLALLANRHERICEKWIGGHGTPDGEALTALLNSPFGDRLFLALTRGSTEPWRKKLNRQIEISRVLDKQRELQAELDALQRGEA